ncbi:equilibrative nucleobase transporter 1-like [Diadema antillarum]|uniref:equilibrative nucleobase transporter 1-like n=1 Tax=Diadema antillarum TaxID=105358 RepID=UPI003A88DB1E
MEGVVLAERLIALTVTCLEILVHGGIIFGWPSFIIVLKDMGYFGDECPESSDIKNTTEAGGFSYTITMATNIQTGGAVTASCPEQDARLQLVYSLATAAQTICMFPLGYFFDQFGTLLSRLVVSLFIVSGYLLMAFSSAEYSALLFPATILFTVGGALLLLSSLQVGNLFPSQRSTVISVMNGMYIGSVIVFLIQKTAYEAGFAFDVFFFIMAASVVLMGINTALYLPRTFIPRPLPSNYRLSGCRGLGEHSKGDQQAEMVTAKEKNVFVNEVYEADEGGNEDAKELGEKEAANTGQTSKDEISIQETDSEENGGINDTKTMEAADQDGTTMMPAKNRSEEVNHNAILVLEKMDSELEPNDEERNQTEEQTDLGYGSFMSCVFSIPFWLVLFWQMVLQLDMFYTFGTINYVIEELAEGDDDAVSWYLNVFSITQFLVVIVGPLGGLLMDRNKFWRPCCNKDGTSERKAFADLQDSCLPLALTSLASLGYSICLLIPSLELQYLTFVFFLIMRSLLFGVGSAVVAVIFPAEHFVSVYGALRALGGLFSLLQYPIFIIQQRFLDDNPFYITNGFIAADAVTLVLPIALYIIARRRRAHARNMATN